MQVHLQALANPSAAASFRSSNATLEVVQAQLAGYLSGKRAAWPRFQFISDAELVDILSNTRDARATQAHIPQLFEGAAMLKLEGAGSSLEVVAMVSAAGEELQLHRTLKARGMPELWLVCALSSSRILSASSGFQRIQHELHTHYLLCLGLQYLLSI